MIKFDRTKLLTLIGFVALMFDNLSIMAGILWA
jgi:hypothetical protein